MSGRAVIQCIKHTKLVLPRFRNSLVSEPKKQEIITFKVDEALRRALQGVQNRSEFIRAAILAALDSVCPLCKGSGILTPDQRKHWDTFSKNHPLKQCEDCHAVHLVCGAEAHP
jgi:hypothetical protein